MSYLLVSPCRNEAKFMRRTLDSVCKQTILPKKWIIVDDGSTDETPEIIEEYVKNYSWIKHVRNDDRGGRSVGPGVIEAFYKGLERTDTKEYDYICKLDMDLILKPSYFENLMIEMQNNPRLGCFSGKPYFVFEGKEISEKCGDEMCVGAAKFYRRECFNEIGGFVREVMWDAIDCHRCRFLGWIACSSNEPAIRFIHLRPMGSSQNGILTGRVRHGFGQYFMGSSLLYFMATVCYRMFHRPYIIGGMAMVYGYLRSWVRGERQYSDKELIKFIKKYQNRVLLVGKKRAIEEINHSRADLWLKTHK